MVVLMANVLTEQANGSNNHRISVLVSLLGDSVQLFKYIRRASHADEFGSHRGVIHEYS